MPKIKILLITVHVFALLYPFFAMSQNLIEGNLTYYNTRLPGVGIEVIVVDTLNDGDLIATTTDSTGWFSLSAIPDGNIDLKFYFTGIYPLTIKNVALNKDTLSMQNIPLFNKIKSIHWSGFYKKSYFWGLFTVKKFCGDTEYINNNLFSESHQLFVSCAPIKNDSVLLLLNPMTKGIELENKNIEKCGHIFRIP